jgi:hypothetical protein
VTDRCPDVDCPPVTPKKRSDSKRLCNGNGSCGDGGTEKATKAPDGFSFSGLDVVARNSGSVFRLSGSAIVNRALVSCVLESKMHLS